MPSFVLLGPRARVATALLAAAACVAAAIAGVAACLTAPPPDIGSSTDERPEIIHNAVDPPEGLIRQLPPDGIFLVPVRLPDPTATCVWRDYDQDQSQDPAPPGTQVDQVPCTTSLLDGGVVVQSVPFPVSQLTNGHCHVLSFVVAHAFIGGVADSFGSDTARWEYEPAGGLCNFYDAGALQDGAFPMDAGTDGLPVTPESGTGGNGDAE